MPTWPAWIRSPVADVNRVAKKYLDVDHAVSATLEPQRSGNPAISSGGFGGQEAIALGEASGSKLPDWAGTLLSGLNVPRSDLHPHVETLPNGITLIVQPTDVSDTIGIYGPHPQSGGGRRAGWAKKASLFY